MKKTTFLLCILFASTILQAQSGSMSRKEGYVQTNDGKRIEGFFEINWEEDQMWFFQKKVVFITKEDIVKKKLRRRDKKKLRPKDVSEYGVANKVFESVKIADSESLTDIPKLRFCERLVDGKIKLFKFYSEPDPKNTSDEKIQEYQVKIWREGMKAAYNVDEVELTDYIGDCEEVVKRYRTGSYGFVPEEDKSVISKLFSKDKKEVDIELHIFQIVADYNSTITH